MSRVIKIISIEKMLKGYICSYVIESQHPTSKREILISREYKKFFKTPLELSRIILRLLDGKRIYELEE